jgi:Protein of unknown function (DUF3800)
MHFVYIDDSKDNKLACFSALIVPVESWNDCLNRLLAIRRIMKQSDGVPLRMEMHTTDWLGGKGRLVRHLNKTDRVRLYNYFLAGITMLPKVRLINAAVPQHEDDRAFEWLLNRINVNMAGNHSKAVIFSDEGKSYDKLFRRMRRHNFIPSKIGQWETGGMSKNLTLDRIVEDIVYRDSARSLFIQAADACAYSVLRSESPIPSKTALGLDQSMMILEPIMVKAAFAKCPKKLGIIR